MRALAIISVSKIRERAALEEYFERTLSSQRGPLLVAPMSLKFQAYGSPLTRLLVLEFGSLELAQTWIDGLASLSDLRLRAGDVQIVIAECAY